MGIMETVADERLDDQVKATKKDGGWTVATSCAIEDGRIGEATDGTQEGDHGPVYRVRRTHAALFKKVVSTVSLPRLRIGPET
jgi:hypothetical protein